MQTFAMSRPSDGAMTRLLFGGRKAPCWDRPLEAGRNLLTGTPRPVAELIAFLESAPAEVTDQAPPAPEDRTAAALRAFGVPDVAQLPDFARRLLGMPPRAGDVGHPDVSVMRGDGRRWLVALLDAAWPPARRRERASRAPHWRRWRRGLRAAYGLAAVGAVMAGLAVGRGL